MLFRIKPRWLASSLCAFSFNVLYPAVAFAQTEDQSATNTETVATETMEAEVATEQQAPMYPPAPEGRFLSDGTMIGINQLGIAIAPPAGWEVITNASDLSLVMQEEKDEKPDYKNAKYRRNITVAAIHRSSPIDEKRATELKQEMTETFSKDSVVSNFQILEHRFFNYQGENDGLLVYSSLKINDYEMMQMHILVSGAEKQFLLSYTDLTERFTQAGNPAFEAAWTSMNSIIVTGSAPNRFEEYARYGALGGGAAFLFATLLFLKRRRSKYDYMSDVEELGLDSDADMSPSVMGTLHGGWKLDGKSQKTDDDDFFMTDQWELNGDDAPRTKRTTYVSNY